MEDVIAPGEMHKDVVRAAILTLFPDAELAADDDGQLVINTNVMWSGKNGDHLLGSMNVGDDEGECWRCGTHIESRVEVVWLDGELRNDCGESEDGAPHEPHSAELLPEDVTIEKVAGENRVMVLVQGFQWSGTVDSSGAGDATFANEREAVKAFVDEEHRLGALLREFGDQ